MPAEERPMSRCGTGNDRTRNGPYGGLDVLSPRYQCPIGIRCTAAFSLDENATHEALGPRLLILFSEILTASRYWQQKIGLIRAVCLLH